MRQRLQDVTALHQAAAAVRASEAKFAALSRSSIVQFQQLDAGAARQPGGAGLGLSVTRYLVEAQGGTVGVRSEPGRGSVFHAVLPRRAAPAP